MVGKTTTMSSRQPLIQKQAPPHLAARNNCERITQGVAKLSAFRIPPNHLKRCSEGMLPFSEHLVRPQPKILINGVGLAEKNSHRRAQRLSSSSNSLLRVANQTNPVVQSKRMLSLDSSGIIGTNRVDWLRTQRMLAIEAEEMARRRKRSCWNGVAASYAFLALSVILSLFVVIGVCFFLHSFVPKEYYGINNGNKMSRANRMDAGLEIAQENGVEHKSFAADPPLSPTEFLMFYTRRRR